MKRAELARTLLEGREIIVYVEISNLCINCTRLESLFVKRMNRPRFVALADCMTLSSFTPLHEHFTFKITIFNQPFFLSV